jgi:hypothetical protein
MTERIPNATRAQSLISMEEQCGYLRAIGHTCSGHVRP